MTSQQFPEPTVGALIFNTENKIFLMRSHKWHNRYTIPGGHLELGETMIEALKREVREETNLDIYDPEFICWQEFIFDDQFLKRKHFIFFDFACKTDSKDVVLNSEGQEYVWTILDNALSLDLDSYTRKTIEEYLKQRCG